MNCKGVSIEERRNISIFFVFLSFVANIIYSYVLSFTERGLPLTDWFNLAINGIWFCVLIWVALKVYQGKPSAKGTLLFLACLVGLLTGIDLFEEEDSILLAGISIFQALFLFGAHYVIRDGCSIDKACA